MHPYLVYTEFASQRLVELIGDEEVEKRARQSSASQKPQEAKFFHWNYITADMQEAWDKIYVMNYLAT